jgi:hypothetical protein
MSDIFHINISSNATNKMELYKIWDNDLKNRNKKRSRWEWAVAISILFVVFGDTVLLKTSFIGVAIFASLQVIKYFTEEAHINYLMHKIDVEDLGHRE